MILLDIHESSHDPETESEILVQYSVCNEHLFLGYKNIYSEHLASLRKTSKTSKHCCNFIMNEIVKKRLKGYLYSYERVKC